MNREKKFYLHRKISFYESLAATEDDDTAESDSGRKASEDALKRALARNSMVSKSKSKIITSPQPPSSSNRQVANPDNGDTEPSAALEISEKDLVDLGKDILKISQIASSAKTHGKRKRESTATTVLRENQIFKGLQFYFFPNNDVAPARRMRIRKAVEYGAAWQKEWSVAVTHVILDKAMTYDSFLKYIKQDVPGYIIVVQENYPADCIAYRTLLDPRLPQFAVKDCNPALVKRKEVPTLSAALRLKPAGKDVRARPAETQRSPEDVDPIVLRASQEQSVEHSGLSSRLDHNSRQINSDFTEEFRQAVEQAKALQELPLEDDEDSEESDLGHGERRPSLHLSKKQKTGFQSFQDKFQCMQKNTGEKIDSPNQATIEILQQMADYYSMIGDEWRPFAYRKVITVLKKHPTKIVTKEDALKLPNIGERLASKIEEIVFTNRLQRLENARAESSDQTLQTFMQIYGVGFVQASKWVHEGHSTLESLLQNADSLSECQRVGIEHYEDFNSRIPRAEVEQHGEIVRSALQKVDPAIEVIVAGSYRRGAETSGDIDCIITGSGAGLGHLRSIVFDSVLPRLIDQGFLVATLASSTRHRDDDGGGGGKWHGASCLPGMTTWRRIDLLLVPCNELGAALIYFTGNDIFNRSLRLLARKKGMRLNQRGLYRDVLRGQGGVRFTEGTLIEGKDEKRIFEVLGVPWRPPEHRVC